MNGIDGATETDSEDGETAKEEGDDEETVVKDLRWKVVARR